MIRDFVRTLIQKMDTELNRRGFTQPEVRRLMRNQLLLALGGTLAACLVTGLGRWGWSFAAGALIISFNFWWLAKAGQELVRVKSGAVFTLVTLFYGRLLLTAVAIAALIAWLDASVFGILAGLSTVMATATLYGIVQIRHKVPALGNGKEA